MFKAYYTEIKMLNVRWIPDKHINQERVDQLLLHSIESNQFTNNGPVVNILEKSIRDKLQIEDSKDIIPVCNGTVAIWVAVNSIESHLNKSLRWATQSFTFPPSAQGMLRDVIIVDIDADGGLELTNELKDRVDGIIVTNVFGNLVDIRKYVDWCNSNSKYLIFDNAATPYSFYGGKNSLNYGHASTISFHHTKPLGFGEGGAVIIDKLFSHDLKLLINFGIDNNSANPTWNRLGSNYKMSDISASYIVQHIEKLDEIFSKTTALIDYFKEKTNNKISLYPNFADKNPLLSCLSLLIKDKSLDIESKLKEVGVFCRKYYKPLLPTVNATKIYEDIICIPVHPDITFNDMDSIIDIILQ